MRTTIFVYFTPKICHICFLNIFSGPRRYRQSTVPGWTAEASFSKSRGLSIIITLICTPLTQPIELIYTVSLAKCYGNNTDLVCLTLTTRILITSFPLPRTKGKKRHLKSIFQRKLASSTRRDGQHDCRNNNSFGLELPDSSFIALVPREGLGTSTRRVAPITLSTANRCPRLPLDARTHKRGHSGLENDIPRSCVPFRRSEPSYSEWFAFNCALPLSSGLLDDPLKHY